MNSTRNSRVLALLFALALIPLIYASSFRKVEYATFQNVDEGMHVRVVQEMRHSGSWWAPSLMGKPYYNKPPLKMWLTSIPLELFGESKFAYRFLDALAGAGTVLLVFFFARSLFGSAFLAFLSALGLIGAWSMYFHHVVRTVVQDSALLFFFTAAMCAGWFFFDSLGENRKRAWGFALLTGVFIGLGALTKSIGGLVPFLPLTLFALLSGKVRIALKEVKGPSFLLLGTALALPLAYYLPHILSSEAARIIILEHEIFDRATTSYHNEGQPWFFLTMLFRDERALPVYLMGFGLIFGLWRAVWGRDKKMLYLLTWAVGTIGLYSLSESKLEHYIVPAFGALAIITAYPVAGATLGTLKTLRSWWIGEARPSFVSLLLGAFALYGIGALGENAYAVIAKANRIQGEFIFDKLITDMQAVYQSGAANGPLLTYPELPLPQTEVPLIGMLEKNVMRAKSEEEFQTLLANKGPAFVVLPLREIVSLYKAKPFVAYQLIPRVELRDSWLAAISYIDDPELQNFRFSKTLIDFGSKDIEVISGFQHPSSFGKLSVRELRGPLAQMLLTTDLLHRELGATVLLNAGPLGRKTRGLKVRVNGSLVSTIEFEANDLKTYPFKIPPQILNDGHNVITFETTHPDGATPARKERSAIFNFMSMRIGSPG